MIWVTIADEKWSFDVGVEIFQFTNSRGADEHTETFSDYEFTGEYECHELYNVQQDNTYNDTVTIERVVNDYWDEITEIAGLI